MAPSWRAALDQAKNKLGDAVDKHGDQIGEGLDKVAKLADQKTKGKYTDKIDTGLGKAKDALDGLDGKDDDIREKKA
jgi:ABC-type transporter Mla subunit MlaD